MSFTPDDIKKVAHLARLNLSEQDIDTYTPQIADMLGMINQLSQIETAHIEPMSHAFDLSQRQRQDAVTEPNLREKYQAIAPQVEAGLYLVPQVID